MPFAKSSTDHAVTEVPANQPREDWKYAEAFTRNLGLITRDEQQRLRNSRVAIAGMGGVGGSELITLARLGVGKFSIADPDIFEVANTNRQYGAVCSNFGRYKADAMAEMVRDVNPEAEVRIIRGPLTPENAEEFLRGADLFVDGIDFFEVDARRMMFHTARSMGVWAITAGPIGFSTAWLIFDPHGLSFDDYFDISDSMPKIDKLVAFLIGVCPRGLQMAYRLDLSHPDVEIQSGKAPSLGLACSLAGAVVTTEAVKILLNRGTIRPVPCYHQFDPYVCKFAAGRVIGGNRNPKQRIKRWLLRKRMQGMVMS